MRAADRGVETTSEVCYSKHSGFLYSIHTFRVVDNNVDSFNFIPSALHHGLVVGLMLCRFQVAGG